MFISYATYKDILPESDGISERGNDADVPFGGLERCVVSMES